MVAKNRNNWTKDDFARRARELIRSASFGKPFTPNQRGEFDSVMSDLQRLNAADLAETLNREYLDSRAQVIMMRDGRPVTNRATLQYEDRNNERADETRDWDLDGMSIHYDWTGESAPADGNSNDERWIDRKTGKALRAYRANEPIAPKVVEQHLGRNAFGSWLRARVTGDWEGVPNEVREMSVGVDSAGGFMVPTLLSTSLLDHARAQARVMQAGGRTIPMESATLKIAKITEGVAGGWRGELDPVSEEQPTIGQVELEARTLAVIVRLSRELFDDAPNIEQALTDTISRDLALSLDLAGLYGSGANNQPTGLRNMSGLELVGMGTDGGELEGYGPLVSAIQNVWEANYEPNGIIMSPRTRAELAGLTDTTGQPLQAPGIVSDLRHYSTTQVPVDREHGEADNASDLFVGQWNQLLMGLRHDLRIAFVDERFSDNLEVKFLAYLRADFAVVDIGAFSGVEGITPPN